MAFTIDLTGRCAVVTGVTSGIGIGIARQLACAGCDIAGCGTRPEESREARAFVKLVTGYGRRTVYQQCDLGQADEPRRFVQAAAAELGSIDVLVSNTGRNVFRGVAECSEQNWDMCMQLDLAAHWRLARGAMSWLKERGDGTVIMIGSNHAFATIAGCFPYNVAKAGLVAMVHSMAIEWGPNIRIIGIAPGFIDTPANDTWFETFPDPVGERRRTEHSHPVGRIGTPDEIGGLCVFLVSSYGRFTSGTTLLIDGGRSAIMQDLPQ
jgi:NAD(P)-dependent dehydrogenase (short-subunit alcohol dehydrogenase family)